MAIADANLELKLAIWEAGLRQHDVAAYLGIADSTLSDYIYGRRRMPDESAKKLARCLASKSSLKAVEDEQRGEKAMQSIGDYEDRIERLNAIWVGYCNRQPLALSVEYNSADVGPRYWHLIYQDGSVEKTSIANSVTEALEDACWCFTDMVLSQIGSCG